MYILQPAFYLPHLFFFYPPCEALNPVHGIIPSSVISFEKAMTTHSSTLAWKIPWAEEPGRLQSMGSLRVGHD